MNFRLLDRKLKARTFRVAFSEMPPVPHKRPASQAKPLSPDGQTGVLGLKGSRHTGCVMERTRGTQLSLNKTGLFPLVFNTYMKSLGAV